MSYFKNMTRRIESKEFLADFLPGTMGSFGTVIGHYMQGYPTIYPQFLRWHLDNLSDVPLGASALNMAAIAVTGRSRPIAAATLTLAVGIQNEINESYLPKRTFDYVDTGCYVIGAIAYVAYRKWATREFQKMKNG